MYSATDTTKFCRKSAQLNPINGTIVATWVHAQFNFLRTSRQRALAVYMPVKAIYAHYTAKQYNENVQ